MKKITAALLLVLIVVSLAVGVGATTSTSALASFDLAKHSLVVAPAVHIGDAGYLFKVKGSSDISVTALGVPSLEGATKSTVNIWEITATLPDVSPIPATALVLKATAEVTVDLAAKDSLGFNYATLATPVVLTHGKSYLIEMNSNATDYAMLYYPGAGETDAGSAAIDIISPSFSVGGTDATNRVKDGADTIYDLAQVNRTFGTPNFLYDVVSSPNPQTGDASSLIWLLPAAAGALTLLGVKRSRR